MRFKFFGRPLDHLFCTLSCAGRPTTEYEERQAFLRNDEDLNHADLSIPDQLTIASRGAKPVEIIRAQSTSGVA